ncbi:hypothetical protein [Streptomyces sp. NPDC058701]|uniref:hypothetical protein n=1 Tax=Streptomyces sp. NPDC058701 TaxID=3346608 RepID=UPI003657D3A1
MRTSTRAVGVLAGLALTLGGAALAAPSALADIPACTDMVEQAGVTVTASVRTACYQGVVSDLQGCRNGLAAAGVPGGAATAACLAAPHEPR